MINNLIYTYHLQLNPRYQKKKKNFKIILNVITTLKSNSKILTMVKSRESHEP